MVKRKREEISLGKVDGLDVSLLGPIVRPIDELDHAWRTMSEPATPAVLERRHERDHGGWR